MHLHDIKIKLLKISTYLPVLFLITLGLSLLAFRYFPTRVFINGDIAAGLGVLLFIIGTPLILFAEQERHQLLSLSEATTCSEFKIGIYKYSRHPGTLGFMLLLFGFGCFINSLTVIIFGMIHMVLLSLIYIPLVEQEMIKVCGDSYKEYREQVRMWL
jgi:protein-S-isoprenylcysteine O-methyltransferase Ste14